MTIRDALWLGYALWRLRRARRNVVLYNSHCGNGWILTVDGRPHFHPTARGLALKTLRSML